jgi:hypothetical protein
MITEIVHTYNLYIYVCVCICVCVCQLLYPSSLKILLHIAGSSMTFGVLGSTGWLLPVPPSDVNNAGILTDYRDPSMNGGLYIPDDRYNLTVTKLTETDILCSQWFLRTPLVSHLHLPPHTPKEQRTPLFIFIDWN